MTTTTIHSILELDREIDTDIIVFVPEGNVIPNGTLDRLETEAFVASSTFCWLQVHNYLWWTNRKASSMLDVFDKITMGHRGAEEQKAYLRVRYSRTLKGCKWFAMRREEWNGFVEWAKPIKGQLEYDFVQYGEGVYSEELFEPLLLVLMNMFFVMGR